MGAVKKKLMPKSAMFVRKYEKTIRVGFASFLMALTVLFLMHKPDVGTTAMAPQQTMAGFTSVVKNGQPGYVIPASDLLQDVKEHPLDDGVKEKAAFITLARNGDLWSLVNTIRHVEDRLNHRYHYDWVFLNDKGFTDEFIRLTSALVSGKAKYGKVPKEHWEVPSHIDKEKYEISRRKMVLDKVPYGDSTPYRHMCRYQSGLFYRHELVQEYDYYWRVDTDITVFCNFQYDIFKFLRQNKKKYGFVISLTEYEETIPTLWATVKEFMKKYPQHIHKNNFLNFISDDGGETYNGCHFWTNFEVGDLNFWRSQAYTDFFNFLDQKGGFYYERWGDAPVHSIAAALLLDKDEIHFFDGFGYHHPDFQSCPHEEEVRLQNKCTCNFSKDKIWMTYYFCNLRYFEAKEIGLPPKIEANLDEEYKKKLKVSS
ncbi:Glycolipid 2-alpha-mannosyltransferase [Nakaseomyces glabratus]